MHLSLALPLGLLALGPWSINGAGEGTFQAPLEFPAADGHEPALVASGDFNKDGKLDLVTADGTGLITLHLQDRDDRGLRWLR